MAALAVAASVVYAAGASAAVEVRSPSLMALASHATDDGIECPKRARRSARASSSAGPLAGAERFLRRSESRRALAGFRRSRAYKSVPEAKKAAFVAMALGRPGAALAALVRAAELRQKDPLLLLNAAALLIDRQRPGEALELIAEVRKLPPPDVVPLGMRFGALLDNAQGHALLLAGRYGAAEARLRQAAAAEPLLAEARTGVGVALECRRKQRLSPLWMARGARRLDFFEGTERDPPAPEAIPDALDLSQGKEASFPVLQAPGTPQTAAASEGEFKAAHEGSLAKAVDLYSDANAAFQAALERSFGTPAEPFFLRFVNYSAWLRTSHPDLVAASTALEDAKNAVGGTNGVLPGFPGQIADTGECPYVRRHGPMWTALLNFYAAYRDKALTSYRLVTGLAANTADPDLNRWLNLSAQGDLVAMYGTAVQLPYYFAQREGWDLQSSECGAPPSGAEEVTDGPASADGAAPCPPELKAVRLKIKLLEPAGPQPVGLDLEVNCDKIKLEASAATHGVRGLGWVGPFAEGSYEFGKRDVTVFVGAKGQLGGKGVGVTGKFGPYVKFGPSGLREFGKSEGVAVKDFGVRVQGATEVNAGGGQVMTIGKWDSKIDFSFVNGL